MKLNLSRLAKKFRELEPKPASQPTPRPPASRKAPEPVKEPAAAPVVETPPVVEPVVVQPAAEPAPAPQPSKKVWEKPKRTRFVREKTEKRERVSLPPLPPPSKKLTARLMTKNLALPPKEDAPGVLGR